MKIQKKVPIRAGFTDKSRDVNAEKAKEKWERKGWTVVNRIDGGMGKTSYLELEKEQQDVIKTTKNKTAKTNKRLTLKNIGIVLAVLWIIGFIFGDEEVSNTRSSQNISTVKSSEVEKENIAVITQKANSGDKEAQFSLGVVYYTGNGIERNKSKAFKWFEKSANQGHVVAQQNLGAMYANGEGVEASHKKAVESFKKAIELGSKDAQDLLTKIILLYDEKQSIVVDILSAISSDMAKVERRFKAFSTVLSNGDITGAIRKARKDEDWLRQFTYKDYIYKAGKNYKDIDDKNTIKMIEGLIKYSQTSNLHLQIYYDNFLEYVDNQKPSLLVKVQDSLDRYQSAKLLTVSKLFLLSLKYGLAYDDYLEHWRTKESIEADETKRNKEQKEAKKKKPFIDSNQYKEKSAQYALAKFITAWQYRDFKDMVKYTQTSWRGRVGSPHGDLANSFNSRYLTSAKLEKLKCKRSLCNISISVTYKNSFSDKIEAHTIKPNVIKENDKWGVSPISALREY